MSQWIRNYNPSQIDGDEWGHILVMRDNGIKTVYHWQDFVDDDARGEGYAWQPLPQSDLPESLSVQIERGTTTWTIVVNGWTVEVHSSKCPMEQPYVMNCEPGSDMAVIAQEAIRRVFAGEIMCEDEDWCECDEPIGITVEEAKGIIDALRGRETASVEISVPASKPKTRPSIRPRKPTCECEVEGVDVNDDVLQGFLTALGGKDLYASLRGEETGSRPSIQPKPWQKNRGK